jgi:hypothetical protein
LLVVSVSEHIENRKATLEAAIHMLARLVGDLHALGRVGIAVDGHEELLSRVRAMQQEVDSLKVEALAQQTGGLLGAETLQQAEAGEVRLHVGCGRNTLPGWLNVDLHGWRYVDPPCCLA